MNHFFTAEKRQTPTFSYRQQPEVDAATQLKIQSLVFFHISQPVLQLHKASWDISSLIGCWDLHCTVTFFHGLKEKLHLYHIFLSPHESTDWCFLIGHQNVTFVVAVIVIKLLECFISLFTPSLHDILFLEIYSSNNQERLILC